MKRQKFYHCGLFFLTILVAAALPHAIHGQVSNGTAHDSFDLTTSEESLAVFRGQKAYDKACMSCHGILGDGDGRAAKSLNPRPRDFTKGIYKFRSTPSGQLPTDEDLYRIVSFGIPRTFMPGWENFLTDQERRDVVAYIKSFSNKFKKDGSGPPIKIPDEPDVTQTSIAEGKSIYMLMECWACHGVRGKGDGKSAKTLKDEWGQKIKAFDFTIGNYKGGDDNRSVYKTFNTGLNGTPMPSYADVFLFGGDSIGDLASFEEAYSDSEIEALRAYLDAQKSEEQLGIMSDSDLEKLTNRRKWALVHFVKSLSQKPGILYRLFAEDSEQTKWEMER